MSEIANSSHRKLREVITPQQIVFETFTPESYGITSGLQEAMRHCTQNNISAVHVKFKTRAIKGNNASKIAGVTSSTTEMKIVFPDLLMKERKKINESYIGKKFPCGAISVTTFAN